MHAEDRLEVDRIREVHADKHVTGQINLLSPDPTKVLRWQLAQRQIRAEKLLLVPFVKRLLHSA
jgi:hypothetical protein